MTKKYALHLGYVISANDGDHHYIGIGQLARLYQLRQDEYIVWNDSTLTATDRLGRRWEDYEHLYPSYEGRYGRPNA